MATQRKVGEGLRALARCPKLGRLPQNSRWDPVITWVVGGLPGFPSGPPGRPLSAALKVFLPPGPSLRHGCSSGLAWPPGSPRHTSSPDVTHSQALCCLTQGAVSFPLGHSDTDLCRFSGCLLGLANMRLGLKVMSGVLTASPRADRDALCADCTASFSCPIPKHGHLHASDLKG